MINRTSPGTPLESVNGYRNYTMDMSGVRCRPCFFRQRRSRQLRKHVHTSAGAYAARDCARPGGRRTAASRQLVEFVRPRTTHARPTGLR